MHTHPEFCSATGIIAALLLFFFFNIVHYSFIYAFILLPFSVILFQLHLI